MDLGNRFLRFIHQMAENAGDSFLFDWYGHRSNAPFAGIKNIMDGRPPSIKNFANAQPNLKLCVCTTAGQGTLENRPFCRNRIFCICQMQNQPNTHKKRLRRHTVIKKDHATPSTIDLFPLIIFNNTESYHCTHKKSPLPYSAGERALNYSVRNPAGHPSQQLGQDPPGW